MLLVHFKKAFPLTLLGHSKEELIDYCFILKVTRDSLIQLFFGQSRPGGSCEHFANDQN